MDALTADERRLIDAAVAAGRVTRVTPGASGLYAGYVYDPAKKGLVALEPQQARRNWSAARRPAGTRGNVRPEIAARRARVREIVEAEAGVLTGGEMAARLGIPVSTFWTDCRQMGLSVPCVPGRARAGREPSPEVAARRAQLPGMVARGLGARDMAHGLGVPVAVIEHDLRVLGLSIRAARRAGVAS